MNRFTLRACSAFTIFAICLSSSATTYAQDNVLRWNLKEGQKFMIETTVDQNQKIATFQMEMGIVQNVTMEWLVKSVDGDKFTIAQTITRMKMNMDSPMMQLEYDSDEGEGEGMAAQIAAGISPMIDAEITFVMDRMGNVSDVVVPDDVKEGMSGAMGMGMGGMGPEMIEQFTKQASLVFPEEAVSVGSEWENATTVKSIGTMKVDNKYKYVGNEDDGGISLHKIGVTSNIEMDEFEIPGGGSAELESIESTGQIWFDNNNGYMTKAEMAQKMDMLIDAMGMEMSVSSDIKTKVKVTLVKD